MISEETVDSMPLQPEFGSSFANVKIVWQAPVIKIVYRRLYRFFGWLFIALGIEALIVFPLVLHLIDVTFAELPWQAQLLVPLAVIAFIGGGCLILSRNLTRRLDLQRQQLWYRRWYWQTPSQHSLTDVVALQCLTKQFRANLTDVNPSQYESVEVNLVFACGKRINLLDHGNLTLIEQQVEFLAQKLNCPVWYS